MSGDRVNDDAQRDSEADGEAPVPARALRERIDELDRRIQELIAERAGIAREIGEIKAGARETADYFKPEREAQVLRQVVERNRGPLSDEEMTRLFREIMSACLAQQEALKVAFLGPEGTFTQSAVLKHFGHSCRALPVATIDEVFHEVERGLADFGVVPVENSTEGPVNNTLDMFAASPLRICGEVELRIHHHLMARGAGFEDLACVYAHPQSLAQCRAWLHEHLPGVERVPVSSNAEAARRAAKVHDAAAIGSEAAAEVYGLDILVADIEDQPDNSTRFLVIGRNLFPASGRDKTSLLIEGSHRPGALNELLQPLARCGLNMTRIESRPAREGKWRYIFFIDVEGHYQDQHVAAALRELEAVARRVTVLGSYPVAVV